MTMEFLNKVRAFREDIVRRKAEIDAERKKNKVSFKRIFAVLFYTLMLFMAVYLVVISCTIAIPTIMGYIIGSFGYDLHNSAEFLLSLLSGLFFEAWLFLGSFLLIRLFCRNYIKLIRKK